MKKLVKTLGYVSLLAFPRLAFAGSNSELAVKSKVAKGQVSLEFRVSPKAGVKVNKEAPWSLKVLQHDGLALTEESFSRSEVDWQLPGFKVQGSTEKNVKQGKVKYLLKAYVCKQDNDLCYVDVHEGIMDWQL